MTLLVKLSENATGCGPKVAQEPHEPSLGPPLSWNRGVSDRMLSPQTRSND
jgi:hypothetical protein